MHRAGERTRRKQTGSRAEEMRETREEERGSLLSRNTGGWSRRVLQGSAFANGPSALYLYYPRYVDVKGKKLARDPRSRVPASCRRTRSTLGPSPRSRELRECARETITKYQSSSDREFNSRNYPRGNTPPPPSPSQPLVRNKAPFAR